MHIYIFPISIFDVSITACIDSYRPKNIGWMLRASLTEWPGLRYIATFILWCTANRSMDTYCQMSNRVSEMPLNRSKHLNLNGVIWTRSWLKKKQYQLCITVMEYTHSSRPRRESMLSLNYTHEGYSIISYPLAFYWHFILDIPFSDGGILRFWHRIPRTGANNGNLPVKVTSALPYCETYTKNTNDLSARTIKQGCFCFVFRNPSNRTLI